MVVAVRVPVREHGAVGQDEILEVDALSDSDVEVVEVHVANLEQVEGGETVVVEVEEVFDGGVDGVRLVVESEEGEAGEATQALQVVEQGRVQAQPLHAGAELRHQFQVVRAGKFKTEGEMS